MTTSRPFTAASVTLDDLYHHQQEHRLAAFRAMHDTVTRRVRGRVRGEDDAIRWALDVCYTGSHGLIFGGPSSGKTTLIKEIANGWGGTSRHLSGTNDTMPSDLTGADLPNIASEKFWYVAGPFVKVNFLLLDEANRYTPGTMAALLGAQQEGEIVTPGGKQWEMEVPFIVLAALNPRDRGTTPLSKANDDRFGLAFRMGARIVAGEGRFPGSRFHLEGGISDEELVERIRIGAPVHWRAEARGDGSPSPYTPEMLARIQEIIPQDIYVDPALDLAIARLRRATCEFGEVEINLRAPQVHRAVAQAYAATDPAGMRTWVTEADVRATWRVVYCNRLQDPTYTDAIARVEDQLFGENGAFRFPKSAANVDPVRYAPSTANGRR